MNTDQLFNVANAFAFITWLILIAGYNRPIAIKIVVGISITLLCIAYAILVTSVLKVDDFKAFSTLDGVMQLMGSKEAALLGWLHYLAFDLMTGVFIAQNGDLHGIRFIALLPCFIFTFMLGPVGLLLYLIIRWAYTRNYFAENAG